MTDLATDRDWINEALADLQPALLRYAASFVGPDRAHDVVQEVAITAMRQSDPVKKTWWFVTCRCRAIDMIRKDKPAVSLESSPTLVEVSPGPPPPELAERNDSHAAVLRELATLPDPQREVLRLKFQAELSYREIGEILSLKTSHVGYLIHHGLQTLRDRFKSS